MIGIKNTSKQPINPSFDGVIYEFAAGEIKVLPNHVAEHLARVTFTCALGASPLKLVAEKDLPKELLSSDSPVVAPTLALLVNDTEKDIIVLNDGDALTVPAKGKLPLPQRTAAAIYERFTGAKRVGLSLKKVEKETKAATPPPPPAGTSGPADAPAPHSDGDKPSETPATDKPAGDENPKPEASAPAPAPAAAAKPGAKNANKNKDKK